MATDSTWDSFPRRTWEDWRRSLDSPGVEPGNNRTYEKLTSLSLDGFPIQPLYGPEETSSESIDRSLLLKLDAQPGKGWQPGNKWRRVAELAHPSLQQTLLALEDEATRGLEGVWLRFDDLLRNGVFPLDLSLEEAQVRLAQRGLCLPNRESLTRLLGELDLPGCHLYLDPGRGSLAATALLIDALGTGGGEAAGVELKEVQGSLGCDPLSDAARGAAMPGAASLFRDLAVLAQWTTNSAPGLRPGMVSTAVFHHAGASPGQELGIAMASGFAQMKAIGEALGEGGDAARQILFSFPITGDLFGECAKLRAARLMWARLVGECGGSRQAQRMALHARTSWRTATLFDRGVNALRGTVETFAAVLGGADAISTAPFDEALGPGSRFSGKVAANTQLILREESFLDRVGDPAAGSWYVEALTGQLAEAGWKYFQSIEAQGGLVEALCQGAVHRDIAAMAARRREQLATRARGITGISEFPHLKEAPFEHSTKDEAHQAVRKYLAGLKEERVGSPAPPKEKRNPLQEARDALADGAPLALVSRNSAAGDLRPWPQGPLVGERDSEPFENLRAASDEVLRRTGLRPRVFLANLGSFRSHRLRSGFARRFLQIAGIECELSQELQNEKAAADAWALSSLPVVVLCGADEVYQSLAAPVARELIERGAGRVLLAGRPGEEESEWKRAGISGYLFLGMNTVKTLRQLLIELGAEL
ncbi:MAG: hypothetical protein K0U98_07315 [Deltaproteobacteria bacterium]|nr:hypothetical protein [Deltaproteobacteria bacterium]